MAITKEQLDEYIRAYQNGQPLISDEKYDMLLEEYLKEHGEKNRPFMRQKQSSSVNDIVGTLPKAYGVVEPWRDGLLTYKAWAEKNHLTENHTIAVQPKFDGCSVAFDVKTKRFFTRGDVDDGTSMDVTEIFEDRIEWVLNDVLWGYYDKSDSIKFEAIMSHEKFIISGLNQRYMRPRDAVTANFKLRDPNISKLISLIPLRGYMNGKQYLPNALPSYVGRIRSGWTGALQYDSIQTTIDELLTHGATHYMDNFGLDGTYSVDGVVVSVLADGVVGDQNVTLPLYVNPNLEIAIKILKDIQEATLETIQFQFGKQGRITPVAILNPPVKFGNVSVDHVTLSTLKRVQEMNLRHHDTVRIMYNIVPYFIDSYHNGDYPIPLPDKCPICGAPLDYLSSTIVRCQNPDCKGLKLGSIIRHAEKMRMVGLGEGVITKLYDNEFVTCISDLYDLRKWDDCIAQTPGFGYTSYDNMVASVDKALSEATLERFLGALPFNDTDEKTWKQIIDACGYDNIIKVLKDGTLDYFIMMHGYIPNVGEGKIQRIVSGYLRNKEEIQYLMEWVPDKLKPPLPKFITKKGRLCFTGFRDKQLESQLEENGWEIGGFSKTIRGLIVPDNDYMSEKVMKAKELNIPIYTRDMVPHFLFQPF